MDIDKLEQHLDRIFVNNIKGRTELSLEDEISLMAVIRMQATCDDPSGAVSLILLLAVSLPKRDDGKAVALQLLDVLHHFMADRGVPTYKISTVMKHIKETLK